MGRNFAHGLHCIRTAKRKKTLKTSSKKSSFFSALVLGEVLHGVEHYFNLVVIGRGTDHQDRHDTTGAFWCRNTFGGRLI